MKDETNLSHLPSLAVDGTETQLLVESYNNVQHLSRRPLHDQSTLLTSQVRMFSNGSIQSYEENDVG